MRSMTWVSLCRVFCAGLALVVVGVWGAPAPVSAQGGLVSATIEGRIYKRSDNSGLPDKTVTATCSYQLPPFSQTFTSLPTGSDGRYTIAAQGQVSGSNCIVKVSPCPGSFPIQKTVRIPPSVSGVDFGCSS